MKKFLLQLKLRQLKWLSNVLALALAFESAVLPAAQAGQSPFICLKLLEDPSAPIDKTAEKAQKEKDGNIRKAQTTLARPLVPMPSIPNDKSQIKPAYIDETLLAYYKVHTDEVGAWLQDIKIRKDSGLVTDVEDLTAYALTSQKAEELLRTLIARRNISIRYGSAFELFHLFDLQKYQATVKRSSRLPLWLWKIAKWNRNYPRAFTITLQRQVPVRDNGDLSLTSPPNTKYEEHSDSIGRSLFVAKDGSDPQSINGKGAVWAVVQATFENAKMKFKYTSNTDSEPLNQSIKQVVLSSYLTSLRIANSPEAIESALRNPELVNSLNLDLNQKAILKASDPGTFMNRIAERTAQIEIPKLVLKGLTIVAINVIVLVKGSEIILGFFPAGEGSAINGNNIPNNCNATPTNDDFINVMWDSPGVKSISPFLDVFVGPNRRTGQEGQPNPCDPDGKVASELKKDLNLVNNDNDAFAIWISQHPNILLENRKKVRAQYNYTDPQKLSACAVYYAWYTRCGKGLPKTN